MKLRRVLAVILCSAVVLTSESFSMGVLAAQIEGTDSPAGEQSGAAPETGGSLEGLPTALPEQSASLEGPDASQATEAPSASAVPSQIPEGTASVSPAATPEADLSASPSVTPEGTASVSPSVTPEADFSASPSVTPEGTASVSPSVTPEADLSPSPSVTSDELLSPSPSATPEDGLLLEGELEIARNSADFLTVDTDGMLKLADGKEIYGSSVVIPANATRIPAGIFTEKTSVKYITFETGSQLTTIDEGAFEGCGVLSMELPAGVTKIPERAFKNSELSKITFKGDVTEIGEEAFSDTPLTSVSAPKATKVGNAAFSNCAALTSVNLPGLTEIGARAFLNCTKLNSGMVWGSGLTTIGKSAFKGCGFTNLNMTAVSGNITLDARVFEECTRLSSVTLPTKLTALPSRLFKNCTMLNTVTLFENLTEIGEEAFAGCTSLNRILIPKTVTKIMAKAFEGCSSLTEISILNERVTGDDFIIAQNAFPDKTDNSKVIMRGYGGKVQEYAENRCYQYESLFEKYKLYYYRNDQADIVVSTGEAVKGEEILVTVTVKNGYSLTGTGISVTSKVAMVTSELVSTSGNKSVFRFTMPEGEATISVLTAATAEVTGGEMTYDFEAVDGNLGDFNQDKNLLTMQKTGQSTALRVYLEDQQVGAWLVKYSSSNSGIVSITDKGVLNAKKKGTATITAALKNNSKKSVSFKVEVKEDAVVGSMVLELSTPARAKLTEEVISENGTNVTYKVIQYNKATLASGARSFPVSFKAYEAGDASNKNLLVSAKWTSVDGSIATVKSGTTTDNTNTITVKKAVEGETMITATVTNKDKSVCSQSFIIRVVDGTPRLADSKISVNSNSEEGTGFDLVPVYGYQIADEGVIRVCRRVVSAGIVRYEPVSGLKVVCENNAFRLRATEEFEIGAGKTITYKGNNALYLQGEFKDTGDTFEVRIPELSIVNKVLNPSIQTKGKINLFYKPNANLADQGSVTVTQNLKNETVDHYELVSEANDKEAGSETPDPFAANFKVEKQSDGSALITRNPTTETLVQKNGKNVVTGYLYIYYKGYSDPVKKKITVSTCNTKPNLMLSMTSATASVYRTNQEYKLQLLDKKTKNPLALGTNADVYFDQVSTTEMLFDDSSLQSGLADNTIVLRVNGKPRNGKAVIGVQLPTWTSELKYTFTLKTTSAHPTIQYSSTKLVLNTLCRDQEAVLESTKISSTEATFAGFDKDTLIYTGNKKYAEEAKKLIDAMTCDSNQLYVKLPSDDIKAMTYSFKVMPKLQYIGESSTQYGKQIGFTVTVKNNVPELKLSKNTFALNVSYPGKETAEVSYSILNIPAGVSYGIDVDSVQLTPVKSGNADAWNILRSYIEFYADEANKLVVNLKAETPDRAFSYEYYVEGLKVTFPEQTGQNPVELKKFKIKISGARKTPSVSVSGKGKINPVDPMSSIVYTAKVNNIASEIESVTIWELQNKNDYYYDGNRLEASNRTSKHFEVVLEGNKATVKVKKDETLDAKTTYRFRLAYKLRAVDDYYYTSGIFSIKPSQTLPKLKTDRTEAYLYAGQNRSKTVDITLTPTSVPNAKITNVVFAKNTPDNVKKAYRVSYDQTTGKATLELVNPASLVLNKKYTITLETKCEHQLENSTGTTFKINVTVRK